MTRPGYYENGKRKWLYAASTPELTFYYPHSKRDREGMDEVRILPNFNGTAVHDGFKTYNSYTGCLHALCNRELTYADEQENAPWADKMKTLLVDRLLKHEAEVLRFMEDLRGFISTLKKQKKNVLEHLNLHANILPSQGIFC